MHPLFLVSQFDELNYQTEYQVYRVNDSLGFVESIEALGRDQVDGAALSVNDKLEEFTRRKKIHKELCDYVNLKIAQTDALFVLSENMVSISSLTNDDAIQCNSTCSQALQSATKAEAVAAEELRRAIKICSECYSQVVSAQQQLDQAQIELARKSRETRTEHYTIGDKHYTRQVPADTTSERAAVSYAANRLSNANSAYDVAERNQQTARHSLDAAQNRVATCQAALKMADDAISNAKELVEDTDYAKTKVKTALDSITDIAGKCEEISLLYAEVSELTEQATATISELNKCLENEYQLVQELKRSLDSFERSSFVLKQALEEKSTLLLSFNQPITRL